MCALTQAGVAAAAMRRDSERTGAKEPQDGKTGSGGARSCTLSGCPGCRSLSSVVVGPIPRPGPTRLSDQAQARTRRQVCHGSSGVRFGEPGSRARQTARRPDGVKRLRRQAASLSAPVQCQGHHGQQQCCSQCVQRGGSEQGFLLVLQCCSIASGRGTQVASLMLK